MTDLNITWSYDRTELHVVPVQDWLPGTNYTITLGKGFKDTAGNPILDPFELYFTTVALPVGQNGTSANGSKEGGENGENSSVPDVSCPEENEKTGEGRGLDPLRMIIPISIVSVLIIITVVILLLKRKPREDVIGSEEENDREQ